MLVLAVVLAAADGGTLDSAERMTGHLENHPIPYFLALTLAAIGALCGVIASLFWWGARGQARLHEQNYRRELERNADLKRERNEAQEKLDRERSENLRLTIEVLTTAKGLARVREELDKEALAAAEARAKREEKEAKANRKGSRPEKPQPGVP